MKLKKIVVTTLLMATLTSGCATLDTINPEKYRGKPVLNTHSIPENAKKIVVIWPGLMCSDEKMNRIRNEFTERHYYPLNINVPLRTYTPKELGDKVDDELSRIDLMDKKVYHVAYSVGGIPLFSYLYEHHPSLEKSVFVCSPLKGSHLAEYYKETHGEKWYQSRFSHLADALLTTGKMMYDNTLSPVLQSGKALLIGGVRKRDNGKIPGPDDGTIGLDECLVENYDTKLILRGKHSHIIYSEKTFDSIDQYFSDSTVK